MGCEEFYNYHKTNKFTKKKCKEHSCFLKNASKDYIIIDGDKIAKKSSSGDTDASSDCILVSKKPVIKDKHDIIVCELGPGKEVKKVKEKITNSLNYICKSLREYDINIHTIKAVYLGKYGNKIEQKKRERRYLSVCDRNNIIIKNKKEIFDVNDL